jgi:cytidylate kinase
MYKPGNSENANLKGFIITIDGPAGSGKSTVSFLLAERLKLNFLTTGAFYRGLAFLCVKKNIDLTNVKEVAGLANYPEFVVKADTAGTKVYIDNKDVTDELATEATALVASQISAYPEVRKSLLELQRAFNRPPGLIAEGRDCGTVVFPNADVKIFLTASLDKRAERRSGDEKAVSGGSNSNLQKTLETRDLADTARKVAPLAKASDTIEIDSTSLNANEVVDRIVAIVKEKWKPKT